jgi:hypothetical protein
MMPAPRLVSPPNDWSYSQGEEIILSWEPVVPLPNNGFYRIHVAYPHRGDTWVDDTPWTKSTSWALSDHAYLVVDRMSDTDKFQWGVQVMRRTGTDAEGKPTGVPASPLSDVRSLIWRTSAGGGGGGGAPPPPPPP